MALFNCENVSSPLQFQVTGGKNRLRDENFKKSSYLKPQGLEHYFGMKHCLSFDRDVGERSSHFSSLTNTIFGP